MYCGNVTRIIIFSQRNCYIQPRSKHFVKNDSFANRYQSRLLVFCSLVMRNIAQANKFDALSRGWKSFCSHYAVIRFVKNEFLKIPVCLKKHSVHIVRTCTQQCECVVAHRIRRGQQIFSLYSRLWEEAALKELVGRMRQQFTRRGKVLLWGAIGVIASERKKITDEEMQSYMDELEIIQNLKEATTICSNCHQRQVVDVVIPDVIYCSCEGSAPVSGNPEEDMGWVPFIERQDFTVWRQLREDGIYIYKVYGKYDDVTADDFYHVQIDTDYRRVWDSTAVELEVLESDPETNSDTIYWEMQWPRMFSNRDYVFDRRHMVDKNRNMMVIVNKGSIHPSRPPTKNKFRVTEYHSYMVIKPNGTFSEPGIEFSLTYYDNPGVNIPPAICSWVSRNALPDYLTQLRVAARELAYCRKFGEGLEEVPRVSGEVPDELLELEKVLREEGLSPDSPEFIPETICKESATSVEVAPTEETSEAEKIIPNKGETESSKVEKEAEYEQKTPSFSSFQYQDPPDVTYFKFHTANLFT